MAKEKKVTKTSSKGNGVSKKDTPKSLSTKDLKKQRPDEVTKFVEVILVLLVVFAAFYLITYWVSKSKKETYVDSETKDTVIQYDEILLGRVLLQNPNEYYVLVVDEKKNYAEMYQGYVNMVMEKEDAPSIYRAYLDNAFNKRYYGENSNLQIENIEDLKVKTTTLLKVQDHKVVESIEGMEAVIKKLNEMAS